MVRGPRTRQFFEGQADAVSLGLFDQARIVLAGDSTPTLPSLHNNWFFTNPARKFSGTRPAIEDVRNACGDALGACHARMFVT